MGKNNGSKRNTRVKRLRDLVFALHLYLNWDFITLQLTTEQRETLADTIDAEHKRMYGDDATPVNRWWRE